MNIGLLTNQKILQNLASKVNFHMLIKNRFPLIQPLIEETADNGMSQKQTNRMTCAPSEDSDQPGYPLSLIRVSTVRMTFGF